jgi:hypothetical protein
MKMPEVSSVVKVGAGRGFVFEQKVRTPGWGNPELTKFNLVPFIRYRRVITAAHCLPHFPLPHSGEGHDQYYPDLLGVIGGEKPSVWAQLIFADPIADIAVLGCPDDQAMPEEAAAYEALVEPVKAIRIDKAQTGKGWMLSLDTPCTWVPTHLTLNDYGTLCCGFTLGGQSGSPLLNEEGKAVGLVAMGGETGSKDGSKMVPNEVNGPQPILKRHLSAELLWKAR